MANWLELYQVFLFDFDGLLVDTEKVHFAAYRELCARRGCELQWDFERFCAASHGKAMGIWEEIDKDFPQILRDGPGKDALYEEKKEIYVEMLRSTELDLMEGAEEILLELAEKGVKRAVVTNSLKAHIDLIRNKLPVLDTIPLWVTREDYSTPKPSPEGYLKAMSALVQPGDKVIGFEDTLKGLKALLAAGVDAVFVCPEHHVHLPEGIALGGIHRSSLRALD